MQGVFAAARAAAPSVIFIDEIDSLAPARGGPNADSAAGEMTGRLVSTLLLAMEEGQPSWLCAGLGFMAWAYCDITSGWQSSLYSRELLPGRSALWTPPLMAIGGT